MEMKKGKWYKDGGGWRNLLLGDGKVLVEKICICVVIDRDHVVEGGMYETENPFEELKKALALITELERVNIEQRIRDVGCGIDFWSEHFAACMENLFIGCSDVTKDDVIEFQDKWKDDTSQNDKSIWDSGDFYVEKFIDFLIEKGVEA